MNLRKLFPVRYKSVRYCRRLSLEHYLFERRVVTRFFSQSFLCGIEFLDK